MHGLGAIYLGPIKQLSTSLLGIAQVMHLLLNQFKEYHNQKKKSSYSGQTAQGKATGLAITVDLPPKPLVLLEMFSNGNCLDKTRDTEFKNKIIKFIREFKEFEENRKKKHPLNKKIIINAGVMSKENTNTQLNGNVSRFENGIQ